VASTKRAVRGDLSLGVVGEVTVTVGMEFSLLYGGGGAIEDMLYGDPQVNIIISGQREQSKGQRRVI
jgi:hypothetical protein